MPPCTHIASLEREASERSDATAAGHGLAMFVKTTKFVASIHMMSDPLQDSKNKFQIYITVLEEPDDNTFHQLPKGNTKSDTENLVTQCTNDSCTEEFSTERELLNHQFVGKCQIKIEFNSGLNSDITKKNYYEKLGWALKTERKSKCFNLNQKDYLTEKFDKGLKTGRKEAPFNVSENMLHFKNSDGTRRFAYDEILSVQQVTSFFSRMCKQNKHLEDDLEARSRETEIYTIRQEILNE
ncbi:Hypothetical predicted protein [Mytilus galloprovincialis]|uniref:C2H2-type domain-containing protein n=1 Tax=Mytilus galloprovincialis TaxID=29158 RepID=A0A8B6BKI2_MYTGA|nr:Hypothetical predicted protein [Mytilus galloprovincialis]